MAQRMDLFHHKDVPIFEKGEADNRRGFLAGIYSADMRRQPVMGMSGGILPQFPDHEWACTFLERLIVVVTIEGSHFEPGLSR